MSAFQNYYLNKYSGRKLNWVCSIGHCILKAWICKQHIDVGVKEFELSIYQAVVLLLFNRPWGTQLTFSDILDSTNIPQQELSTTLLSLSCGKSRVLIRSNKKNAFESIDAFEVNPRFRHQKRRIKINQIQLKETKQEVEETNAKVHQDRQYQIDAAIGQVKETLASFFTHS